MTHSAPDPPVHDPELVSVVVPAWNAAGFLPSTLDSILAQTWPRLEVIVVDDGSTDETSEILAGYGERIRVIRIPNSGGPSRPRNVGVEAAHGDLVAFFDSDDLMEPRKIEVESQVLRACPDVDLVCTNFRSIDLEGNVLTPDYLAEYHEFRRDLEPTGVPGAGRLAPEAAFHRLVHANFVGTSSVVCRRRSILGVGGFDESMKNSDDLDMWRRLADAGSAFAFVDEVLHSYRVNPEGVTARGANRFPARIKGLRKHLNDRHGTQIRREVEEELCDLLVAQAWSLRRQNDLAGAERTYREALRYGRRPRALTGLAVTLLRRLLGR